MKNDKYSLAAQLDAIYAAFPEGGERPVIGLTANYWDGDASLRDRYYNQVVKAGGVPVLLPPVSDAEVIINTLSQLDGLLLSGGADYNPLWAGEEPSPHLHHVNATRDLPELLLTRLAYNRQLPMLGICRGIQTLAMALDGEVEQDIYHPKETTAQAAMIRHSQDADRWEPTHRVAVAADTVLHEIYGCDELLVNSFHHQAVRTPGPRFRVSATSPDGVIEAMESCEEKSMMGVQWHPEWLGDDGLPLFRWLVDRAREYRAAKRLHDRILTIDTHVDTPMFFPQGIDFGRRDPRIKVDLHKLSEGRQDAVFMVAYIPQAMGNQEAGESPFAYANDIFDKIESIVAAHRDHLALARTPADLVQNKQAGRKSIVLGIENGLALEGRLEHLPHFRNRGVAYMTLCHNGHNDICSSARSEEKDMGVFPFGEKVIREMNRLGMMVDLSHGSEQSFYDALDISCTPIVCSHSNSKALCNHPRNLTDDQLRALAAHGGVAHTTFYPGFLRTDSEATIRDGVAHLEHAIQVMGIDHVGIGTDFDGDGGVPGMNDASEVINFTIQLLRCRYSESDIRRIWGGNWLRVMQAVQDYPQTIDSKQSR